MLSAPALKLSFLRFYGVINGGKRREGQTEGAESGGQETKKGPPSERAAQSVTRIRRVRSV